MASKREQELEAILRELVPATRDVLWCALVWNDHNFDEKDLRDKADRAAKSLGFWPRGLGDQIGKVNAWLERVDKALRSAEQHSEKQP
jgi:hypothetical protein